VACSVDTGKIVAGKHAELSDPSLDAPAKFQQIDGCLSRSSASAYIANTGNITLNE
jgi:hypothetical protein